MKVWLVTVGEPLPLDGQSSRLWRTGRLARRLARHGHQVTWWTSTFDHLGKTHVRHGPGVERAIDGIELVLLDGIAYRRNASVARLVNHLQIGRAFSRAARVAPAPDVILCSFPTIELSLSAVRVGVERGVPVVLDIRDLWPDLFETALPRRLRPLGRLLLQPYAAAARAALTRASALIAISPGYLKWGLAYAGRSMNGHDRVFPIGYEVTPLERDQVASARTALVARGVDPTKKICWFAGSFSRTMDLAPVIEAARMLWASGRRDTQFVFSGAGEREAGWSRLAGDVPSVLFTGWLDQHGLRAMLEIASIGLAPYAGNAPESLTNKVFEYMSAGLPIVSSLQGEAELLLRELGCGTQYDPSNVTGLARTLASLLDDPANRTRMAELGRAAFSSRFDAERIDAELIAYLEAMAAGRPARAGPR